MEGKRLGKTDVIHWPSSSVPIKNMLRAEHRDQAKGLAAHADLFSLDVPC